MPPTSAAMELKVLINILTQGQAVPQLLNQVNQLSAGLTKLQQQSGTGQVAAGIVSAGNAGAQATQQMLSLERAVNNVTRAVRFLAGGFLALRGVQFVKEIADIAARTEVLTTVLHVVAENAGVTATAIDDIAAKVRRLGITAQSANESLTKFLQARLNVDFAAPLARAAQDLAVISGMDSSATFQRLIVNIQQLDTLGLRLMGIVVSRTEADAKYKQSHKEITGELTKRQQQESLLIEVIDKARGLEGAYEAAMGNVGKQLTSLTRYTQDLRSEIGKQLLPAYSAIISELSLFLAKMNDQAKAANANTDAAREFGEAVRTIARYFFSAIEFIVKHRQAVYSLIAAYSAYWAIAGAQRLWSHLLGVFLTLTTYVEKGVLAIRAATTATLEWAAATEILNVARAQGVAQSEVQLALDFGDQAAKVGRLASIWERLSGVIARFFQSAVVQRLVGVFRTLWSVLVDVGGVLLSAEAVFVGIFVGIGVFLAKFTSIGSQIVGVMGKVGTALDDVNAIINDQSILAWNTFAGVLDKAKEAFGGFLTTLGKAEDVPFAGNFLYDMKTLLTEINNLLDKGGAKLHEWRLRFDNAVGIQRQQMGGEGVGQNLVDVTEKLGAAREAEEKGKVAAAEVMRQNSKFSDEYKTATETLEKLAAVRKGLEAEQDQIIKSLQSTNPQAAANAQRYADEQKALHEYEDLVTSARTAAEKLKNTVENGKLVSKDANEALSDLTMATQLYEKLKKDAEEAAAAMRAASGAFGIGAAARKAEDARRAAEEQRLLTFDQARNTLATIHDQTALEKFTKQVQALKPQLTKGEGKELDDTLIAARQQVSEFETPAQQKKRSRRDAELKKDQTITESNLAAEMEIFRSFNEGVTAADQELYAKGQLSIEKYYQRRRAFVESENQIERRQAAERVKAIENEQTPATLEQQKDQESRLAVAQNEQRVTEVKAREKLIQLDIEQKKAREDLNIQTTELQAKNAAVYGDEKAQLEALNVEYEARKRSAKDDPALLAQLAIENQLKVDKIHLENLDKMFVREEETLRLRRETLSLNQAIHDVAVEEINAQEKQGRLTELQAMRLRNIQLFRQRDLDMETLSIKTAERRIAQDLRAAKVAEIVTQMRRGGQGDSVEELQRLQKELAQLDSKIEGLTGEITNLDGKIKTTASRLEEYGDQIRLKFGKSLEDALVETTMHFKTAGDVWKQMAISISSEIVRIFARNLAQRISRMFDPTALMGFFGMGTAPRGGGGLPIGPTGSVPGNLPGSTGGVFAEGGVVTGPGTGTSDSIPAMVSAGEHIMPADKAARWMPLLEGIRLGKLSPAFALGGVVTLQSIAPSSLIPRRYAGGGVVISDAGASAVTPGGGGNGNLTIALHPDAMNMTLREWLEQEVVRQQGRR